MTLSTSGTVSTTTFRTRKVIDHAFRRCKTPPQKISGEDLQTALDLLYLTLSTLGTKGIALWCINKVITPLYENVQTVPLPVGTIDVLNCNLRTPQRVTGLYSSSSGTASFAFDGDLTTSTTEVAPGGFIQMQLDSGMACPIFGILPNATGSWSIKIQASLDGATWVDLYTNATFAAVDGEWQWVDVEGVVNYSYYRLLAIAPTVLDVTEFYVGTMPQEIPLAKINRDDYSNLNNKFFGGRPTQFWYDRQRTQPLLQVWPAPQLQFTFSQIVSYTQRYVQDVGTLVQELDIPQRWYLPIVCELARQMARELPQLVDPSLISDLDMEAARQMAMAWDGETDSSKSYLRPNISCYTR